MPPHINPHQPPQVAQTVITCNIAGTSNRLMYAVPVTGMTTAVTAQQGNVLRILDTRLGCHGIMDIDKALLANPPQFPLYLFAVFTQPMIRIQFR